MYEIAQIGTVRSCPHCGGDRVLVDEHTIQVWECEECCAVEVEIVQAAASQGAPTRPQTVKS